VIEMKFLFLFLTMATTGSAFTGTIDDSAPNPFFANASGLVNTSSATPEAGLVLPMGVQQTGGASYIAVVVGEVESGTSAGISVQAVLSVVNSGQVLQRYPIYCYEDSTFTQQSDARLWASPFPASNNNFVSGLWNNITGAPPVWFRINSSSAGQSTPFAMIALPFRCKLDFNQLLLEVLVTNNPPGTGDSTVAAAMACFII
jgi:hypothetical protein